MKLLPAGKIARVFAVAGYVVLLAALIASLGGLKSSFRRGAGISTASPVGQATHTALPSGSAVPASPAGTPSPAGSSPSAGQDHIRFVVSGAKNAAATVEIDGNLPVHVGANSVTREVLDNNAITYTVASALMGSGTTTVKIFINGKLMAAKTATGGVNVAEAAVVKNRAGVWVGVGD